VSDGILCVLSDCHNNWAALHFLMEAKELPRPPDLTAQHESQAKMCLMTLEKATLAFSMKTNRPRQGRWTEQQTHALPHDGPRTSEYLHEETHNP
jgi:hypothetical protein